MTLDELDRLNRERTQGEWKFWHPDDPDPKSPWQIAKRNGWEMERPSEQELVDNEFWVALANACDPAGFDLLGRVRRGEEAEAKLAWLRGLLADWSDAQDDVTKCMEIEVRLMLLSDQLASAREQTSENSVIQDSLGGESPSGELGDGWSTAAETPAFNDRSKPNE